MGCLRGDEAIHQRPLDAVACCTLLLLMCALLMTSSHSEGPWQIHETSIPYTSTVQFTDGGETTWEKRER